MLSFLQELLEGCLSRRRQILKRMWQKIGRRIEMSSTLCAPALFACTLELRTYYVYSIRVFSEALRQAHLRFSAAWASGYGIVKIVVLGRRLLKAQGNIDLVSFFESPQLHHNVYWTDKLWISLTWLKTRFSCQAWQYNWPRSAPQLMRRSG